MGYLYITRHGQTVWNVADKVCGATDIELTDFGRQQAIELGNIINDDCTIKIDEIVASPLIRAKDTASYISEITGIPMRTDERIREQNFGKYEGVSPRNRDDFVKAKAMFACSYEGGESMLRLAQRIYNLLDEIKASDKIYILVAHNGISRVIQSYFYEMTNEEYAAFGVKNCAVIRYEF